MNFSQDGILPALVNRELFYHQFTKESDICMKRYLPFIIIGGVALALLLVGTLLFRANQPEATTTALPAPSPEATTAAVTPAAASEELTLGPKTAVPKAFVNIEEYGDYQCPPCGNLHPMVSRVKKEFGDKVKLTFYQLPLTQIHKNAMAAARAAVAAKLQNKFWEMHNRLYDTQLVWAELEDIQPIVLSYAKEIGLDVEKFKRDMDGRQVAALIQADVQRAASLKYESTPTLIVEGQEFPTEKLSEDNLRLVINRFLAPSDGQIKR